MSPTPWASWARFYAVADAVVMGGSFARRASAATIRWRPRGWARPSSPGRTCSTPRDIYAEMLAEAAAIEAADDRRRSARHLARPAGQPGRSPGGSARRRRPSPGARARRSTRRHGAHRTAAAGMKLATPRWWYVREPARRGGMPVTRSLLTPVSWIWAAVTARRIARATPLDPGVAGDLRRQPDRRRRGQDAGGPRARRAAGARRARRSTSCRAAMAAGWRDRSGSIPAATPPPTSATSR